MASDTPWLNSGSFVKFLRLEGAAPRSQLSERQLRHRGCCGLLSRDKTLERLWRWKGDTFPTEKCSTLCLEKREHSRDVCDGSR